MKTSKSFKINLTKGTFTGPKLYMCDQGNVTLDRIMTGKHSSFNKMFRMSPNSETAILVWMQTDYAEWKGMQQAKAWMSPHG